MSEKESPEREKGLQKKLTCQELVCVYCCSVAKSCPTFCNDMDVEKGKIFNLFIVLAAPYAT